MLKMFWAIIKQRQKGAGIMIFISSKKVENKLALGELSEWEKVKYFLLPAIITGLMGGPIFLVSPRYEVQLPPYSSPATLLGGVLVAWVTYIGVKHLFRTNEEIDGKDFIIRYTVLSVPVFVRFMLIATPSFLVSLLFIGAMTRHSPEKRDYVPIIFNAIFPLLMIWYYVLVDRSFKRFAESRAAIKIRLNDD